MAVIHFMHSTDAMLVVSSSIVGVEKCIVPVLLKAVICASLLMPLDRKMYSFSYAWLQTHHLTPERPIMQAQGKLSQKIYSYLYL